MVGEIVSDVIASVAVDAVDMLPRRTQIVLCTVIVFLVMAVVLYIWLGH